MFDQHPVVIIFKTLNEFLFRLSQTKPKKFCILFYARGFDFDYSQLTAVTAGLTKFNSDFQKAYFNSFNRLLLC
jgi:hypothetical protein